MLNNVPHRNNIRISGRGLQPMLFAHGFGCDQNMWRFVAPAFENDYQVVLFDYVGSGKSDLVAYRTDRYSTLTGYVDDILEVIEALDLREVILVGHSVSAVTGMLAAIRRPEAFDRLIMIGPSACYVNDGEYVGGFERADIDGLLDLMAKNNTDWSVFLAPVVMKNGERPELAGELGESFCALPQHVAEQFARATFFSDNRADVSLLRIPTLIIQLSDDAIAPVPAGEFLHRNLPGSTFHLLDAAGHCPHMSHPKETIQIMQDYLDKPVMS